MSSIVLLTNDLRLHDNKALYHACKKGEIIPVFVFDNDLLKHQGEASRIWLYYALKDLNKQLNNKIVFLKGCTIREVTELAKRRNVDSFYFNRTFEPAYIRKLKRLSLNLSELGLEIHKYNSQALFHPAKLQKKDGGYYKVFSAFFNNAMKISDTIEKPLSKPKNIQVAKLSALSFDLDELELLPKNTWYKKLVKGLDISEEGALKILKKFISSGKLENYKVSRDYMAQDGTSRLSAYLHFGQISPRKIYFDVLKTNVVNAEGQEHFIRELMFREFAKYLLWNVNTLGSKNFSSKFDAFLWSRGGVNLAKWKEGCTGIPIVDAGMRELYQTGFMHNRVRMIVGSFLVKNLLIDWRQGKKWFENTLFDADLASNAFSWQWVAGSGVDAAPYFRIFNPVLQSEKFDKKGEYIKKFVPELAKVDPKYIHEPHKMPEEYAKKIKFKIGVDYPLPCVDLKKSREKALEIYRNLI